MLSPVDLKNNTVFKMDGQVFVVLRYEHVTQGRGGATIKVKVRNIKTGAIVEKGFNNNDKVEEADIARASYQYLYSDEEYSYFMNISDFEQINLSLVDDIKYLKEGEKVIIVSVEGSPAYMELPNTVSLKIDYTEPGTKGNTVNNALKKAVLETGLEINVPMFINVGEIVKVNTQTGDYIGRA